MSPAVVKRYFDPVHVPPKSVFQQLACDASAITTLLPKRGDRSPGYPVFPKYQSRLTTKFESARLAIPGTPGWDNLKKCSAPVVLP